MATATAPPPPSQHSSEHTEHILPYPFSSRSLTLLAQGAEALVYRTTFLTPSTPCILKYRPPKPYRHPVLDKRLTRSRLLAEARVLVKCRREGVGVPGVLGLDAESGWLVLEWVEGGSVRAGLEAWVKEGGRFENLGDKDGNGDGKEIWGLMRRIGREVGRIHAIGVCHGDLTTSNLMVRTPVRKEKAEVEEEKKEEEQSPTRQTPSQMREAAMNGPPPPPPPSQPPQGSPPEPSNLTGEIVLIDFGLATQTVQDEDRAVDLYVLERAFVATHPGAEKLFDEVLRSYGESYKGGKSVLRKLEDVRLRGRKRSMLG